MMQELKTLELNITSKTSEIETKIDNLDATRKGREDGRKSIVLKEMKKLLVILNDVDKKVSQDLKMEAFDNIRSMNRLRQDILSLEEKLRSENWDPEESEVVEELSQLKNKANMFEESFSVENLSLSVSSSQDHMTFLSNTIRNAVYLKTPELDPRHYSLDCSPMFSPMASSDSHIELRVHCSFPTRQFNQQVLAKLVLSIYTPDGSHYQSKRVLEEGTINNLIRKKKAFLATPTTLVINVKKPKNLVATIEVKLLETDVLNSPKVFNFLCSSVDTSTVQDLTRLDMTGTGMLCRADLDITEVEEGPNNIETDPPGATTPSTSTPASPNSANPFPIPSSSLQQSGPTQPKQRKQSSPSHDEQSDLDQITYYSPLNRTDPHLLLNSSLTPGNRTLEASYLPDPCWDDSMWCPSPPSSSTSNTNNPANTTLWEMASSPPVSSVSCNMKYECVYRAMQDPLSTRRIQTVLLSPYDITLYSSAGVYLVSEPHHNRVGVYTTTDMSYRGLLGKGLVAYDYPTSILELSAGGLVLLDRTKMNIFNERCQLVATFQGRFYGLAEGENDEFFTFSYGDTSIVKMGLGMVKDRRMYEVKQRTRLTIMTEFENWRRLSKPSHLVFCQGKIMMSDKGLHKIFTVDLVGGQQSAWGYFGEGLGQFKRPSGMVVDKSGNLILVDEGNNRILMYQISGKFVKVITRAREGFKQPCGISIQADIVMVAFLGNKDGLGGVIKYKMS